MPDVRHRDADAHGAGRYHVEKTARVKAETALEASEKQLRMLVQGVVDYAIFMLDPQGFIQTWNTGAERLKGYRAAEIIGRHFSQFYPPEDLRDGKPQRELEIATRTGKYEEEGWRLRKDGTRFWANVLITAVFEGERTLAGFIKVTRDMTERRESERIRSIVEHVVDGILTVSETGLVESFNAAAERIFGYRADEVLGRHVDMLLEEGTDFDRWTAAAGMPEGHHGDGRRKDGSLFAMEITLGEFHHLGRRAFTAVVRDVSERRRAEDRMRFFAHELQEKNTALQRSNQELDDFAYIASHDLKEPLRGIHNYANFLIEDHGARLDDDGRAKLDTLARLAQRMESLIDSLLEFSRVGRLDLAMQATDMNEVVRQTLAALQVTLQQANVEVRLPRPLPAVRADRSRVAEVFQNLIVNAVKYNDKLRKEIEIGAEERGGETVFYVRDNGIGISERHHEAIFRIFKRLHGRDKFGGGSGAGLTIVKKIVERHGGRIWLESVPGEGSTFCFTLAPEAS